MTRVCLSLFFLLLSSAFFGQCSSSLSTQEEENDVEFHSPRKASIKSAILPGLGQIYNEKYWKVPVVYIGLGVSVYYIDYNNGLFKTYKKALIAELDGDPLTINDSGFSSSQLDELQDTYRRWRDLSWVALSAVYLLNIIDANVDGHLFHFDVGEELGMSILPYVSPSTQINTGVTLSLNF